MIPAVCVCECVWLVAMSSQMTSPGALADVFVLWLVIKVPSAHTHTQQDYLVAFTLGGGHCVSLYIPTVKWGLLFHLGVLRVSTGMCPEQQPAAEWFHKHVKTYCQSVQFASLYNFFFWTQTAVNIFLIIRLLPSWVHPIPRILLYG